MAITGSQDVEITFLENDSKRRRKGTKEIAEVRLN